MKNQRSKNSQYAHIKDVLASVIKNCRKESSAELSEIRKIWDAELDKTITEYAQPTAIRAGTLLVTVKSSTLTHQLRFLTKDIIHLINAASRHCRISELKIKTGNF